MACQRAFNAWWIFLIFENIAALACCHDIWGVNPFLKKKIIFWLMEAVLIVSLPLQHKTADHLHRRKFSAVMRLNQPFKDKSFYFQN